MKKNLFASGIFLPRNKISGLLFLLCASLLFMQADPAFGAEQFKKFLEKPQNKIPILEVRAFPDPKSVSPGKKFKVHLQVSIGKDWHIYSMEKQVQDESVPTRIIMNETVFPVMGGWKESAPRIARDEVMERVLKTHSKFAEFVCQHSVPEDIKTGIYFLSGTILFRACNNKVCTLPKELPFKTQVEVIR